jgi:hypothetical protein
MRKSIPIFILSLFAYSVALCNNQHAIKDTAAFENDYVIVNKNKAQYASGKINGINTRILVALSKLKLKSSKGKIKMKRGAVMVFSKDENYYIRKGDYFEVAVKENHPKPTMPEIWHEPTKNKTVYQDEELRVFEERLYGGEDRDLHSHLQRLVVRLNQVHLTDPRYHPQGQEGVGIQVPNTVKFAEPVEHVVRNLSKIPLFNIVIEFKGKK